MGEDSSSPFSLPVGAIRFLKNGSRVLILGRRFVSKGTWLVKIRTLQDNREKIVPVSQLKIAAD